MPTRQRVLRTKATGLLLPGTTGSFASCPDAAGLNIGPDADFRAKLAMTDWTPPAVSVIAAKYGAAGQRGFRFEVTTAGRLQLIVDQDGTNDATFTSTVGTGITDGATKWVRATFDGDNGAAGKDVAFYTSDDGSSWSQLGTTVTIATAWTAIKDTTAVLEIGSRTGGSNLLTGRIFSVSILQGIDGTAVCSPDFSAQMQHTRQFFDTERNPWTVNADAVVL